MRRYLESACREALVSYLERYDYQIFTWESTEDLRVEAVALASMEGEHGESQDF